VIPRLNTLTWTDLQTSINTLQQQVNGGSKANPFISFTHSPVANLLHCASAKKYENWLKVDKVIAIIKRRPFLDHGTADKPTLLHAYNTASATNSATFYADSAAKQLNINNHTYNDTMHKQCIVDAFNK